MHSPTEKVENSTAREKKWLVCGDLSHYYQICPEDENPRVYGFE